MVLDETLHQQSQLESEIKTAQSGIGAILEIESQGVCSSWSEGHNEVIVFESEGVALVIDIPIFDGFSVKEQPVEPHLHINMVELDVIVNCSGLCNSIFLLR